jgi:hypothetical protein
VLPDADDFPPLTTELAVDAFIASHIVGALFAPESAITLWKSVALRAPVPKAAINEDSDSLPRKSEVRSALDGEVATPTRDSIGAEQSQQRLFRCLIPSAENAGHYLGPFVGRKYIRHLLRG